MTTNNTTTIYGPDGTVLSTANTSDLLARIAGLEARIAARGSVGSDMNERKQHPGRCERVV